MSSTYAIRQMDHYFKSLVRSKYYYKECAINARSPENEADPYGGVVLEEPAEAKAEAGTMKPSLPLKDIVKAKYVVCLECGKKMRTLKAHIRKAHNLLPKEYYQRFGLDPKKFPLVCKEYSERRSKMAKDRAFGVKGGKRKTA